MIYNLDAISMPYQRSHYSDPDKDEARNDDSEISVWKQNAPPIAGPSGELPRLPEVPRQVGLPNLGNTCFINSILQCLLTVEPLVSWLNATTLECRSTEAVSEASAPSSRPLTVAMADLFKSIHRGNYEAALRRFKQTIDKLEPEYRSNREQDAQEFLLFLLNGICEEDADASPVRQLFAGQCRTRLLCPACEASTSLPRHAFLSRGLHRLFTRGAWKRPSDADDNFLSLCLPLPVAEETNHAETRPANTSYSLTLIEVQERPRPLCRRLNLTFSSDNSISEVYQELSRLIPEPTQRRQPRWSPAVERDCALIVQATSNGFGDWFLTEFGAAENLVDGLDITSLNGSASISSGRLETEADQSILNSSLLYGDDLFLVHVPLRGACTSPLCRTDSEEDNKLVILFVHTMKKESSAGLRHHPDENDSIDLLELQRISPPFVVNVPMMIEFDELKCLAFESFGRFVKVREGSLNKIMLQRGFDEVRFWIVDAGPEELCELGCDDDFPLLHQTVEDSLEELPTWMLPPDTLAPKVLRLLVVWPHYEPVVSALLSSPLQLARILEKSIKWCSDHHEVILPPTKRSQTGITRKQTAGYDLSIEDCLNAYLKPQTMSDIKDWQCKECAKKQTSAVLHTHLVKVPRFLILQLNRFQQGSLEEDVNDSSSKGLATANWPRKITSMVRFPVDGLNLSALIYRENDASKKKRNLLRFKLRPKRGAVVKNAFPPPEEFIYDLQAVCNHRGSIETGHYTAFSRSPLDGTWKMFNDMTIKNVPSEKVVQSSAYILFYERRLANDSLVSLPSPGKTTLTSDAYNQQVLRSESAASIVQNTSSHSATESGGKSRLRLPDHSPLSPADGDPHRVLPIYASRHPSVNRPLPDHRLPTSGTPKRRDGLSPDLWPHGVAFPPGDSLLVSRHRAFPRSPANGRSASSSSSSTYRESVV